MCHIDWTRPSTLIKIKPGPTDYNNRAARMENKCDDNDKQEMPMLRLGPDGRQVGIKRKEEEV